MKIPHLFLVGAIWLAISPIVLPSSATAQTVGNEVLVRDPDLSGGSFDEAAAFEADATYIAWLDNRADNGDVYVQKLSAAGAPLWGVNGVAIATAALDQSLPVIAPDGDGGAVFAWLDSRGIGFRSIYAQRVSAAGAPQWAIDGVLVSGGLSGSPGPWIYRAPDGSFVLSWWTRRSVPLQPDEYPLIAQKIDSNGNRLWGEEGVDLMEGITRGRSVHDGAGGLVAVGKIREGGGFRFQRIRADQSIAWPTPVDFDVALPDDVLFNFTSDGAGGIVVTFLDGTTVRAIRVTSDGAQPWDTAASTIVTSNIVASQAPIVAGDGQGGAFVAWIANSPRDVRVQHIVADGSHMWPADGAIVPDGSGTERDAAIAADGAGGVYLSFETSSSLRAQRLDSTGTAQWFTGTSNGFSLMTGADPIVGALADGASFVYGFGARLSARKIYSETTTLSSRLANISTRAFVGTGAAQAIPGFVIGGTGDKEVLIRAIGPTLGGFGVAGTLADPVLTLFDGANATIGTRDNWGEAGDAAQVASTSDTVGAFALSSGSLDAAFVTTLSPGTYTAGITGSGDGTGAGLVEVYDADAFGSSSFLSNLSSRVFVGAGEQQAIPGIVIEGNVPLTLLIRAVGPTLGGFGVEGTLADPAMTLFNNTGIVLTTNDNWGENGSGVANAILTAGTEVGAFDLLIGSLDSAILTDLGPGSYTVGVTGTGGATGICLIEIYLVQP